MSRTAYVMIALVAAVSLASCATPDQAGPSTAVPNSAPGTGRSDVPRATPTSEPGADEPGAVCIASGGGELIAAALHDQGDEAVLCPGAVFELTRTIEFTAPDQAVYTLGKPTDDTRAMLSVADADLTTAVGSGNQPRVYLGHLQIDGNRDVLGVGPDGGLIEWGGNGADTVVEWVRAFEPRGWSVLVLGHGDDLVCRRATARHNELGPAGHAEYVIADGISLACRDSVVEYNTIVDATDGGIVIFQAPGSYVAHNTIRTENRIMYYGISMVDSGPYGGDFGGTRVIGNRIEANGALIRYGLPMGPWVVCMPDDEMTGPLSRGAQVSDNVLAGDRMGYGFVIAGVEDWTVMGNVDEATHLPGKQTGDCFGKEIDKPGGFQVVERISGGDFQDEFVPSVLGWGGAQWPLHLVVNESCLADRIGSDLLASIRNGSEGPIWPSLEVAPGSEFMADCMDTFAPPPLPSGAAGVAVAVESCEPACIDVRLMNWGSEEADVSVVRFEMNDFPVPCPGLPLVMAPGDEAVCRIDRYVGPGFNVLEWYGVGEEEGSVWGFTNPIEG